MDLAGLNALDAGALERLLSGPPAAIRALLETAAAGGSLEAQLRLGQLLLDEGAAVDALAWFGRAAEAGHAMGMNLVGRCLEAGHGTRVDKARAAAWYRAAADRGLDWGLYNLATLLALGEGVERDRAGALALFARAAAKGHAKSMTMVGSFHEDGWTVPADRSRAARWYARGAEAGDFRGQFNHARLLVEDGRVAEALPWLARLPGTATPRFLRQVRCWAAAQADPRVRHAAGPDTELADAIRSH